MTHREIIRDPDTGEVLVTACVTRPFTADERAAMVELARYAKQKWAEDHPDDPDGVKAGERQRAATQALHERVAARVAAGTHPCPGCGALGVPRHQLACKPCWLRLPADLRNAVNGTYRARSRGSADATRRSAVVRAHRRALLAALDWYRDHRP